MSKFTSSQAALLNALNASERGTVLAKNYHHKTITALEKMGYVLKIDNVVSLRPKASKDKVVAPKLRKANPLDCCDDCGKNVGRDNLSVRESDTLAVCDDCDMPMLGHESNATPDADARMIAMLQDIAHESIDNRDMDMVTLAMRLIDTLV